jgi:hypothetical protein
VTVEDLLARLIAKLEAASVPHMLTGSYASSVHSIPRATRDIDIVIFPNHEQLTAFVRSLPSSEYHVDTDDALNALKRRLQFNVIDYATGWKVDFIIPPFTDFNMEEFERRRTVELGGIIICVASAEDIVIAKMLWARSGESALQIRDAAAVVSAQGSNLDRPYIEGWVRRLGLAAEWENVWAQAAG